MSISFSHDINIREFNRSFAIVLLNLLLISFNFEKARSGDELETGNVSPMLSAV
jgi:hypothetical protein